MDTNRRQLPAELNEYIDKRIARALSRKAHAALRDKIDTERATENISLINKLMFVFYIFLGALIGFATLLLLKYYLG